MKLRKYIGMTTELLRTLCGGCAVIDYRWWLALALIAAAWGLFAAEIAFDLKGDESFEPLANMCTLTLPLGITALVFFDEGMWLPGAIVILAFVGIAGAPKFVVRVIGKRWPKYRRRSFFVIVAISAAAFFSVLAYAALTG